MLAIVEMKKKYILVLTKKSTIKMQLHHLPVIENTLINNSDIDLFFNLWKLIILF